MLSQEYVKMWERLEKLEILLYEQQAVIAQLLEFYTAFDLQALLAEKEDPALPVDAAAAAVAAAAVSAPVATAAPTDDNSENRLPDEAFYRSLNNAHRDNLSQVPEATDQELARIWNLDGTEKDTDAPDARKKEKEREKENEKDEVYTADDYKDYRGESINEHGLQELRKFTTLDKVALGKLKELDALSAKLLKDSQNLRDLRERLISSSPKLGSPTSTSPRPPPKPEAAASTASVTITQQVDNKMAESVVDVKLRQMYLDSNLEEWNLGPKVSEPQRSRPNSQLSTDSNATDSEIMAALGIKSSGSVIGSPRHSTHAKVPSPLALTEPGPGGASKDALAMTDFSMMGRKTPDPLASGDKALGTASPTFFSASSEKMRSSSPFGASRTRQDGYISSPRSVAQRMPHRATRRSLSLPQVWSLAPVERDPPHRRS
ncbi:uncharacterized protein LOC135109685 [Scylla paramamosain]|uniref:uncharacterized protein LOC135109685 n=1 Tax=Scylla paramamosain TaxID=85552 RepID=UPI00308359B4